MKKLFFIIYACIVLAIPCFAADSSFIPFPVSIEDGTLSYNYTSSETTFCYGKLLSNGKTSFYAISDSSFTLSVSRVDSVHPENDADWTENSASFGDYFYKPLISSNYTIDGLTVYPYGTSDASIQSDFAEFLANLPNEVITEVTFTLPRGNVLYFKVAENQNVHFTSDFMANSALLSSGTYGPWGDTQQRFGAVASLPTSSTVFPLSSQNPITWYKSANQNILGQTKTGATSISCVTGQYYCFYNPSFSYVSDTLERDVVGGTVHVNGKFSEIKIYPLSQQLTIENGQILMPSDSNDGYASYFDGTANENGTVTFTDQDGNIGMPVNGGQNQQDDPITAQGLIESIKGTLQKILKEIESLFTFGYEAIQSLVNTISDFTSVFAQLYTWLPSPVYQALISAIIIAITIGVFKVFL